MHRWLPAGAGATGRWWAVMGLTLARIPLSAVFAATIVPFGERSERLLGKGVWVAAALLAVIEITDGLDGFLARRWRVPSKLGAIADPYADSVARVTVYWALAWAGYTALLLPLVMAIRDISVAYCRLVWIDANRSPAALLSGKLKAVAQGAGAFALLLGAELPPSWSWLPAAATWIVSAATCASGIDYGARTVPLLFVNEDPKTFGKRQ